MVVTPRSYNRRVGLALCCPLTTRVKGYPFEVILPKASKATGAILADQLKSLDWRARRATRFDRATADVIAEVTAKITVLVDP